MKRRAFPMCCSVQLLTGFDHSNAGYDGEDVQPDNDGQYKDGQIEAFLKDSVKIAVKQGYSASIVVTNSTQEEGNKALKAAGYVKCFQLAKPRHADTEDILWYLPIYDQDTSTEDMEQVRDKANHWG